MTGDVEKFEVEIIEAILSDLRRAVASHAQTSLDAYWAALTSVLSSIEATADEVPPCPGQCDDRRPGRDLGPTWPVGEQCAAEVQAIVARWKAEASRGGGRVPSLDLGRVLDLVRQRLDIAPQERAGRREAGTGTPPTVTGTDTWQIDMHGVLLKDLVVGVERGLPGPAPSGQASDAERPGTSGDSRLLRELLRRSEAKVGSAAAAGIDDAPSAGEAPPFPLRAGRYQILEKIAQGGIGIVYRAREMTLGRDIAIKMLREGKVAEAEAVRRFVEECQISGQLQHPGIVPVHEMGILAGEFPYLTMKLVRGETLAAQLKRRLDFHDDRQRLLSIFEQIAQTLAYAHARGVIHRDLKPSNIMLGRFGEVQLMDWGLAKVLSRGGIIDERRARRSRVGTEVSVIHTIRTEGDAFKSQSGSVMGTPAYMSPEQARGEVEEVDERSDVFGLGAILCEILTGQPPYVGDDVRELQRLAARAAVGPALARVDECDADAAIVSLAKRCLAPEPRNRPRDAGVVAETMRKYFDSMGEKARAAELEAAKGRERVAGERKARLLELGLAIVLLLALTTGGGMYLKYEHQRQELAAKVTADAEREIAAAVELRGRLVNAPSKATESWDEVLEASKRAVNLASMQGVEPDARKRALELQTEVQLEIKKADLKARVSRQDARTLRVLEQLRMTHVPTFLPADEEPSPQPEGAVQGQEAIWRIEKKRAASAYSKAFEEHFRYFDSTWDASELQTAASQIRGSAICQELARALDDWALLLRDSETRGSKSEGEGERSRAPIEEWKKILHIAMEADPDPLRVRIREALIGESLDALNSAWERFPLREYEQPGVRRGRQPSASPRGDVPSPLTYDLLSRGILELGKPAQAIDVLRQAHVFYPGDFWINHGLGAALASAEEPSYNESLDHLAAAVSLRPTVPHVLQDLGALLVRLGATDEAASLLGKAVGLDSAEAYPEARYRLGDALLRLGDVDAALRAFNECLRLNERDTKARVRLAQALSRRGDRKQSMTLLREAIRLDPSAAKPYLMLAAAHELEETDDGATETLRLATGIFPRDSSLQYALGLSLLRAGKIAEAVNPLQEALRLRPGDSRAELSLASCFAGLGRGEPALRHLTSSLSFDPEMARLLPAGVSWRQERMRNDADRLEGLLKFLTQMILDHSGSDAESLSLRGVVLLRLGESAKAAADFEEALRLDGKNALALRSRALVLCQAGEVEKAVPELERSIESAPEDVASHNNLGVVFHHLKRHAPAIASLRKAARCAPDRFLVHYNLAMMLAEQGHRSQAAAELQRAIEIDEEDAEARVQLVQVLLDESDSTSGVPSDAFASRLLDQLRRALELAPRHPGALRCLGRTFSRLGRLEEARTALERSLKIDPLDASTHLHLGRFLIERGSLDEAADALEQARRLDPGRWEVSYQLGRTFLAQREYARAIEALRHVIRTNPQHDETYELIQQILNKEGVDVSASLYGLVRTLDEVAASDEQLSPLCVDVLLLAWRLKPDSIAPEKPLALALREVTRMGRQDLRTLVQLARTQHAASRLADAIETLEETLLLPSPTEDIERLLEEYRKEALPDLLTYGSIDAFLDSRQDALPRGSRWRYSCGLNEPTANLAWTESNFPDDDWKEGTGPWGYRSGGMGTGTLLEEMPGSSTTVYLRRLLDGEGLKRFRSIVLSVKSDGGFVAYLNGSEVGRKDVHDPLPRPASYAGASVEIPALYDITEVEVPRDLLRPGRNVIAIRGITSSPEDLEYFLEPNLIGELTEESSKERCLQLHDRLRGPANAALRSYLEGRLLQRDGSLGEAAEKYLEAIRTDNVRLVPFLRLLKCLKDPDKFRSALAEIREKVLRGEASLQLAVRGPEAPGNLSPEDGGTLVEQGACLLATPFVSFDRKASHALSRWQIRAEGADYSRNPVLDIVTDRELESLPLVKGLLLPRQTYFFRVSHTSSDGRRSSFSDETSFKTGNLGPEAVALDLSPHFNVDLIANQGDEQNGSFETEGSVLTVEGFDGTGSSNPNVRGLPPDGKVGVHRLGDFGKDNCLQIVLPSSQSVRIPVAPGYYAGIRFLLMGGFRSSWLPAVLEYADGSWETETILCPHWSHDPGEGLEEDCRPIWNGMDRLNGEKCVIDYVKDAALFESYVSAREDKPLAAVVLDASRARYLYPGCRFHLFAATAMRTGAAPLSNLGRLRYQEGRYLEALQAFRGALEGPTQDESIFRQIVEVLGGAESSATSLVPLREQIDRLVAALQNAGKRARDKRAALEASLVTLNVLSLLGETERASGLAEREVADAPPPRASSLERLAEIQGRAGRTRDAIITLERAASLPGASPGTERRLRELRRSILPEVLSVASIDDFLQGEVIFHEGDTWRYFKGRKEPSDGMEWTTLEFEDGSWPEGRSGFGYGDGDDSTILGDMRDGYSTLYLRRMFEVADPQAFGRVLLSIRVDDGFLAYLNGEVVGRYNVPDAPRLPFNAQAMVALEPTDAPSIDIAGKLRRGKNVVAIQGFNSATNSSDFSLIPVLCAFSQSTPADGRQPPTSSPYIAGGDNKDALTAYLEGRTLMEAGEFVKASQRFKAALALGLKDWRLHYRLAQSLEALGRAGEAAALVRSTLGGVEDAGEDLLRLWVRLARTQLHLAWPEVLRPWPSGARTLARTLVETSERTGQLWRFTTQKPDGDFWSPEFDDGAWEEAPGGFGSVSSDALRTLWRERNIWLRRRVDVDPLFPCPDHIRRWLVLRINHNDSAAVFVNGTEVARLPIWSEGSYHEWPVDLPAVLHEGTNLIAIHCSDIYVGQFIDAGFLEMIRPRRNGVSRWDFDGDLASSTGGESLVPYARSPAVLPEVSFETAEIAGGVARVARFSRGTAFELWHGLDAGEGRLRGYTLMVDVRFVDPVQDGISLWRLDGLTGADAWELGRGRGIGIGGNSDGDFDPGTWHRLALVVDHEMRRARSYIDGTMVHEIAMPSRDDREFSVGPAGWLLDGRDMRSVGGLVNSVQIWDESLADAEISALGGPTASGIGAPAPKEQRP